MRAISKKLPTASAIYPLPKGGSPSRFSASLLLSAVAATSLFPALTFAVSDWTPTAAATYNWGDNHWSGGVPNSTDAVAFMENGSVLSGQQQIQVANQTVGKIVVGDLGGTFTQKFFPQSTGNILNLNSSTGTAIILANGGSTQPTFSLPLLVHSDNLQVATFFPGSVDPNNPVSYNVSIFDGFSGAVNLEVQHVDLTINGGASYSGNTTLDGGYATLELFDSNQLPSSTNVSINDTTDSISMENETQQWNSLSGTGCVSIGGGILILGTANTTYSGKFVGTGQITLLGNKTMTLTGSNSGFSGIIVVDPGVTLSVPNDAALGATGSFPANLDLNGSTLITTGNFSTGRSINIEGGGASISPAANTTLTITSPIQAGNTNSLSDGGPGTLVLTNAANSFSGITLSTGLIQFSADGDLGTPSANINLINATLELTANTVTSSHMIVIAGPNPSTIFVDANAVYAVTGVVTDFLGTSSLTVAGSGTLILTNNANAFSGTNLNGTLSVASDANLGTANTPISFGTHSSVGPIHNQLPGNLITTQSFPSPRAINLGTAGATFSPAANTTLTLTGTISGSNGFSLAGPGTLLIQSSNAFSGGVFVPTGTLAAGPIHNGNASLSPFGTGAVTLAGGNLALRGGFTGSPAQQIVSVTGFNQDVIVEKSAASALTATTAAFDSTDTSGFDFYENGYKSQSTGGFASPGTFGQTVTSASNPNVQFAIQPYAGNNVLKINALSSTNTVNSATLSLVAPEEYSSLQFLEAAANGNVAANFTLHFTDGTSTTSSFTSVDWFSTVPAGLIINGRITRSNDAFDNVGDATPNPRLYESDYTLNPNDADKVLTSITFQNTNASGSPSSLGIFSVSGTGSSLSNAAVYTNPLTLTADANVDVTGSIATNMGPLTIGSNKLTLTGAPNTNFTLASTTLTGNPTFDIAPSLFLITGPVSGTGSITKNNTGTLLFNTSTKLSSLTINAGAVWVYLTQKSVLSTNALTLSGSTGAWTSGLNLAQNSLVVEDSTNHATTLQTLQNEVAFGNTNVDGIYSMLAGNSTHLTLAVSDNAIGHLTNFGGVTVDANSIIITQTFLGDANLDGIVDIQDLTAVANHWQQHVSDVSQGDFDHSGFVDIQDLTFVATHWQDGVGAGGGSDQSFSDAIAQLPAFTKPTPTPEPASLTLLTSALFLLTKRRRK